VDYSGQMVEGADGTLPSTESAVADGVKRMRVRNDRDLGNMPPRSLRKHQYLKNP
jgi:hypothetical protein